MSEFFQPVANRRPRMSLSLRAALAASTILFPAAAHAQVGPQPTAPPVFTSVDEHGVDIISGRLKRTVASVQIGPGGPGSLSYRWPIDVTFNEQQDSYGFITQSGGSKTTVTIGGSSSTFTYASGTYTSDEGNGSTLVASGSDLTYTSPRGAVAVFSTALVSGSPASNLYKITSLTYPSGETLTYYYRYDPYTISGTTYDTYNVRSIASSLGYQMRIGYSGHPLNTTWQHVTSVVVFDMADETCDPAATSCTLVGTWPSLTFNSYTATSTTWSGTLTDSTGVGVALAGAPAGITITQPSGSVETYTFSGSRVTEYTDGKGIWRYQQPGLPWNPFVFLRIVPNASAAEVYNLSFTTGRMDNTQINGLTTYYTYDSKARTTQIAVSGGPTYQYTYDARGNVSQTRTISATPGTPADIVTTASYPSSCSNAKTCNQPDYTVDANGQQTDYTYDSTHGGTLTITKPAASGGGVRPQTRFGYTSLSASYKDGTGTVISGPAQYRVTSISECTTTASCAGTADEVKTVITYGANDALQPVSITKGAGDNSLTATTAMTYTDTGDVKTVDGPLSGTADTTRAYYDSQRRVTGVIGPDPDGGGSLLHRALRTTYNSDGLPSLQEAGTATSQSDTAMSSFSAQEATATDYDAQNRVGKVRQLVSGSTTTVTQYSYTDAGKPECTAVRTNPSTYGSLPSSACTAATAGSYGPDLITQQNYGTYTRPTSTVEGVGSAAQATTSTITYNSLSQVATLTDGENNTTTVEYDGVGRPIKVRFPSATKGAGTSSTTDYQELTYDAASNVTSRRLRDGTTISLSYDNLGRLTTKNLPGSEPDVTYSYDLLGRMTGASSSTATLTFGFDALGRNTSRGQALGTVSYQYDAAGRRTRMTWPDSVYVDYDYSVTGEVTAMRMNGATSGAGVIATYAYDNLGRRTSLTRGNGTVTTYGYDSISRLSSLAHNLDGATTTNDVTTSFTYSPASQIASITRTNDLYAWNGHANVARGYTANGLNQMTASGATSIGYDARGNITSSGSDNYSYSSENLLTGATVASVGSGYEYDPLLRLLKTTGPVAHQYLYDGANPVAIYTPAGAMLRRFVFGPGTDELVVEYFQSTLNLPTYSIADERGSIVARTDSSGVTSVLNSYDEYGIPASTNQGRYQYTGQAWIAPLGMSYYKARMYSPTLGRFMQTDPIGYADGMNMYAYVGNDPVNKVDPSGLAQICWTIYYTPGRRDPNEPTVGGNIQRCADIPDYIASPAGLPTGVDLSKGYTQPAPNSSGGCETGYVMVRGKCVKEAGWSGCGAINVGSAGASMNCKTWQQDYRTKEERCAAARNFLEFTRDPKVLAGSVFFHGLLVALEVSPQARGAIAMGQAQTMFLAHKAVESACGG